MNICVGVDNTHTHTHTSMCSCPRPCFGLDNPQCVQFCLTAGSPMPSVPEIEALPLIYTQNELGQADRIQDKGQRTMDRGHSQAARAQIKFVRNLDIQKEINSSHQQMK